MRCPKSRFPIWIIVFDELEFIIFVSQGLTLSTASLVINLFMQINLQGLQVDNYESNSKDAGDGHDVDAGFISNQSLKSLPTRLLSKPSGH